MEHIPDNLDDFEQHEREDVRHEKRLKHLAYIHDAAEMELKFVTVPMDNGNYEKLY